MATTPDGPTDEALLGAFLGGDREAFTTLVSRHQRRVYAICYRYFGTASDAEDAAQEAFLTLLRRAETFTGASQFATWMYRVTMNTCNDLARKRARRPQSASVAVEDLALAADDVLASRELRIELNQALQALDPEHREAVLLHDVLGVPYADLAERWDLPLGTVKSRIHRAHARLATLLADLAPTTPGASVPHTAAHPERHPTEPSGPSEPPTS